MNFHPQRRDLISSLGGKIDDTDELLEETSGGQVCVGTNNLIPIKCISIIAYILMSVNAAGAEPLINKITSIGGAAGGITITVELSKSIYSAGTPISLAVRLKNVDEQEVKLRVANQYTMYKIVVTDEEGIEMPKTLFAQKQFWGAAFPKSFISLAPGQEYSVVLPINRLFDMTLAGKYTINVSKPIVTQKGVNVVTSAPTLTVEVVD